MTQQLSVHKDSTHAKTPNSDLCHLPLWYALKAQHHLPRSQWAHLSRSDLRSSCGSASGGPFYGRSRRRGASAGGLPARAGCSWRPGPRKTAEPPADKTHGDTQSDSYIKDRKRRPFRPRGLWMMMTQRSPVSLNRVDGSFPKPPKSEDYGPRDLSPERPCHLGPVSSRGKASPPASACCCSTEAERPVKQAAAACHRATGP